MAEDYEILPHKLLSDLKDDVEALKKKLMNPDAKANELILEMESLKDSVHELTNVFQRSLEELKTEDHGKSISEKLSSVINQNETIAHGMVAISDKLEEFMQRGSSPATGRHSMGMQMPMNRVAPRSSMDDLPPPQPQTEMPPPPPPGGMNKKKVGDLFK